ncbi:MAG: hypothetical protein Q7S51_09895 [Gallionellaceae bacterium]|nr:hypothetical protein [Gallionellaceae bacterium]
MNFIKKHILSAMLSLSIFGLTASLGHADTLSDLQSQCAYACHNVIVLPSGWSLDGTATGKTGDHDLAGWNATVATMGDGKCGFTTVGPGGTARSVAAQYLYDRSSTVTLPPTATFTPTPTSATPSPTFTFTPTPTVTSGTPTYTATFTPTTTSCPAPTPLILPSGLQCSQWLWTGANGCTYYVGECQTPTATFTPTPTPTTVVSPTPTTTGPHTWYDYDYLGGRCFAKDHSIMERKWCEQHGMKGGGNHPSLTGYDRHAHLDAPGQKP